MEIFYSGNKPSIKFEWKITRGKTNIKEGFGNAMVWVFLTGEGGMRPISVIIGDGTKTIGDKTSEQNIVYGEIPVDNLDVGVYGLKLIWVKDAKNVITEDTSVSQLLAFNKCCYSEIYELFGITPSQYADTNMNGSVTFHLCSSAATYGNDGLSAYESAVLLGKTTLSEDAWVRINRTMEAGEGEKAIQQCDTGASAKGDYSFAVGNSTEVLEDGYAGFAEGSSTHVKGVAGHAGGVCTRANGTASVAQGYWLITTDDNIGEAAFGKYNETREGLLFSVGGGSRIGNAISRKNMFEVMDNGDIYIMVSGVRTRLQDCLALIGQVSDSLVTNNVIASNSLNIPDTTSEQVAQPLANVENYLGSNRVISAYTDTQVTEIREAEAAMTEEEILSETQPSNYYSGAIIGHFD